MKKVFKWFLLGLGGLLCVVLAGLAVVYVHMELRFNATHDAPEISLTIRSDPEILAEGERIARIKGCNGGCHGDSTEGRVFFDMPDGTRVVAPDLGRIADEYSIAELARVIRHGIRPDGTSVLGIMPSAMYYWLSERDLAALIGFLQSQAPGAGTLPATRVGPVARAMMWYFSRKHDWNILPAEQPDRVTPRPDANSELAAERGRYQALTSCTECHGTDLRGVAMAGAPSLAVVAAYSLDDFRKLMREGVPIGDRELALMKLVATGRFAYFTDDEVVDLYAYLSTLATQSQGGAESD